MKRLFLVGALLSAGLIAANGLPVLLGYVGRSALFLA